MGQVVRGVPRAIPGIRTVEVLVVDDGSADGTAGEARKAGAQVLHHPVPRGVGSAFHSALAYALEQRADLFVSIDADGQFDPADIPALVAPVVGGQADFTTASRFKDPALTPEMPALKRWGNRMMSRLISRLSGQTFHDVSCGMRCYSRRAALQLYPLARFTYTQEVFLNLVSRQLRIVEVPVRVRGERKFGRSRVADSLWRYALRTALIIVRVYRDYWPLRFFGALALGLLGLTAGLGGFFLLHYTRTGQFRPHTWAAAGACVSLGLAALMIHMGLVGDMLNRHRVYLEELLWRQREGPPGPRSPS